MADTYECTFAYKTLTDALVRRMLDGEDEAARIVAAMALLIEGWRPGDPDPSDLPPDHDDGHDLEAMAEAVQFRRAA